MYMNIYVYILFLDVIFPGRLTVHVCVLQGVTRTIKNTFFLHDRLRCRREAELLVRLGDNNILLNYRFEQKPSRFRLRIFHSFFSTYTYAYTCCTYTRRPIRIFIIIIIHVYASPGRRWQSYFERVRRVFR